MGKINGKIFWEWNLRGCMTCHCLWLIAPPRAPASMLRRIGDEIEEGKSGRIHGKDFVVVSFEMGAWGLDASTNSSTHQKKRFPNNFVLKYFSHLFFPWADWHKMGSWEHLPRNQQHWGGGVGPELFACSRSLQKHVPRSCTRVSYCFLSVLPSTHWHVPTSQEILVLFVFIC